jgi:hypothetical protein
MLVDKKGNRVSELQGPGHGGPWEIPRPELPSSLAPAFVQNGTTLDRRGMFLAPVWHSKQLASRITFRSDHWTCECGSPRRYASGNTAIDAFCAAYFKE